MKSSKELAADVVNAWIHEGNSNLDAAAKVVDGIIEDTKSSQWIIVKDRLPGVDLRCVVFGPCGIKIACWNNHYKCWDDEYGDDYWKDAIGYFTHWMPLPELPAITGDTQ